MPIGIDTNLFSPQLLKRKKNSLLYVGRIASIKKVDVLIDTMCKLRQMRPEMFLTIVGSATNTAENEYKEKLEKSVHELKLPVIFTGPVTWRELPRIYSEHELCINLTPPGAFDKVIGEALACECDIVTANLDLREILNHRILESVSSESLADFLHKYQYHEDEVRMIRKVVIHEHSLTSLVQKVLSTTC